jgi:uncharacterized membrane-anchored protein
MNVRLRVAALVVLSVTQLAAAGWSIARYESTLRSGARYRFRTLAVDPADAFRGRYVAVRPSVTMAKPIAPETEALLERIQEGETGYALLATGADGFAQAARVVADPPPRGDYLRIARVRQQWTRDAPPPNPMSVVGYDIDFPFDRYYMNEAAAPEAEVRYAGAAQRNAATTAWLDVRVKDGVGVIEGLFIDGRPIEEVVAVPER